MVEWKPVIRYESDPVPDEPRVLDGRIHDFIVTLHRDHKNIWRVSCEEIGQQGKSLSTSNRSVAEQQAVSLVEKRLNEISVRSGKS